MHTGTKQTCNQTKRARARTPRTHITVTAYRLVGEEQGKGAAEEAGGDFFLPEGDGRARRRWSQSPSAGV